MTCHHDHLAWDGIRGHRWKCRDCGHEPLDHRSILGAIDRAEDSRIPLVYAFVEQRRGLAGNELRAVVDSEAMEPWLGVRDFPDGVKPTLRDRLELMRDCIDSALENMDG